MDSDKIKSSIIQLYQYFDPSLSGDTYRAVLDRQLLRHHCKVDQSNSMKQAFTVT
jgi:hypothetical protein